MILVLLLTGIEKLVNIAIKSDHITQAGLYPLSGKSLRLNMQSPQLNLDILFQDAHIRLEPVKSTLATQTSQYDADPDLQFGYNLPNCMVTVNNVNELLNLIQSPDADLSVQGDNNVLDQVRFLMSSFSPDFVAQLEPLIGVALASQLTFVITQLKSGITHTANNVLSEIIELVNDMTEHTFPEPDIDKAEPHELERYLAELRANIEHEKASLDIIKAEKKNLHS